MNRAHVRRDSQNLDVVHNVRHEQEIALVPNQRLRRVHRDRFGGHFAAEAALFNVSGEGTWKKKNSKQLTHLFPLNHYLVKVYLTYHQF